MIDRGTDEPSTTRPCGLRSPYVLAALDVTLRKIGGVPTYLLTDNEKTVTVEHVAGIAVRNPQMLAFAAHYSLTVHTCEPVDPASKGGSESTVKLAKADLLPKDTNLLSAYGSFAELEAACTVFCVQLNARTHRVTQRAPVDMLAEEQARLHRLPVVAHTVAFGLTRTVADQVSGGGKDRHGQPDLGDDGLCGVPSDAGDLVQPVYRGQIARRTVGADCQFQK